MFFNVPYPPSLNNLYRVSNNRIRLSRPAKQYYDFVPWQMFVTFKEYRKTPLRAPVEVVINIWPPDARRHDVDNLPKILCDCLQRAGVIEDDNQIEILRVYKQPICKGGKVLVEVQPIDKKTDQKSKGSATGRAA